MAAISPEFMQIEWRSVEKTRSQQKLKRFSQKLELSFVSLVEKTNQNLEKLTGNFQPLHPIC